MQEAQSLEWGLGLLYYLYAIISLRGGLAVRSNPRGERLYTRPMGTHAGI